MPALELVDVGAGRCGTAAEAAAADARTVALVGGLDEACADALGRLAAASGLAFATGAPGAVPARTGSVRTTAGSSDGGVAAATLAGDLGATRIAILEDGGRGEDAVGDAVARAAEEEGIAVAQRVLVAPGTANDVVLGLGDVDAIVLLAPPAPAGLAVLARAAPSPRRRP